MSCQKEDLDGEIDLRSCVGVSEFDVEKNYGFQIQVDSTGICFTYLNLRKCSKKSSRCCYVCLQKVSPH